MVVLEDQSEIQWSNLLSNGEPQECIMLGICIFSEATYEFREARLLRRTWDALYRLVALECAIISI